MFKLINYFKTNLKFFVLKRIKNKYLKDENSWALITGCTSGIGKAYAKLLSEAGTNLILVSRNESKLKELQNELKNVKTFILPVDFSKCDIYTNDNYKYLLNQLKDKRINLLINNVGRSIIGGNFNRYSIEENKSLINVNILSHLLFTLLLNESHKEFNNNIDINNRVNDRTGIINISSYYGTKSIPGQSVYSGCKSFLLNFSETINYEMNNYSKTDVLCVTPLYVKSNMVRLPLSFFVLEPEDVVIASFLRLGFLNKTHGNWRHSIHALLYNIVPKSMFNKKMYDKYEGFYKRLQASKQRRQMKNKVN